MPGPKKTLGPSDFIAGAVAGLALLMLVLALHLPFWLGVVAAVAVYGGLSLLRRPAPDIPTVVSSADMLAELTALSQKIAAHAIRLKIGDVVGRARALLNYLQSQPDDTGQWEDYVRDCLSSAVAGARRFAGLSPYLTDPSDQAVVKFGAFLDTISQTLDSVHHKLVGEDTASFSSQIDTYKSTLDDINQVYLGEGKSS